MTVMVSPRDIPTENLSGNVVHNSWAFLISTEMPIRLTFV